MGRIKCGKIEGKSWVWTSGRSVHLPGHALCLVFAVGPGLSLNSIFTCFPVRDSVCMWVCVGVCAHGGLSADTGAGPGVIATMHQHVEWLRSMHTVGQPMVVCESASRKETTGGAGYQRGQDTVANCQGGHAAWGWTSRPLCVCVYLCVSLWEAVGEEPGQLLDDLCV